MARNLAILDWHIRQLAAAYNLSIGDNNDWLQIHNFITPPGYNMPVIPVLIEVPQSYPMAPPGVPPSHLYLPADLRYHGRKLSNFHEDTTPGWGSWAWYCYRSIGWNMHRDNLMSFMELIRADMTKQ